VRGQDGVPLVAVEADRPPVAARGGVFLAGLEDACALRVQESLAHHVGDRAAVGEERVERQPRVRPLGLGVQVSVEIRSPATTNVDGTVSTNNVELTANTKLLNTPFSETIIPALGKAAVSAISWIPAQLGKVTTWVEFLVGFVLVPVYLFYFLLEKHNINRRWTDYLPIADGSLAVVVADVTGHGVGPGLLMAEARAYLRTLALETTDVGEILTCLNRLLADDVDPERYVTLLLAKLNADPPSLVYASAGHPACYVLEDSGSIKARLKHTGLPLGVRLVVSIPRRQSTCVPETSCCY